MSFNEVIQFILNPIFPDWLLGMKIIFLLLSLFFIGFIIFALIKTRWLRVLMTWDWIEFFTYRHFGLVNVNRKWRRIQKRFEMGKEPESKLAIIEADTLLDGVLKEMGYAGQTLDERLDVLTLDVLANLEEVRKAHQIRSNIVHDLSYHLDRETAKKVLNIYEKALINLQAF